MLQKTIQKTAEVTGDLTGNKIADIIAKIYAVAKLYNGHKIMGASRIIPSKL